MNVMDTDYSEKLNLEYRASLVLLACAVAFIGTHAAVALCEQFRLALSSSSSGWSKYGILILVSFAFGGVGFACTQYVVFTSIRLRTAENDIVYLQYNPGLIAGSIFVSSFVTFIGLYIASTDECFNKSKKEIMEIFIHRTSQTRSIGEIKRMGKYHILFLVCTSSLHRILASGVIFGGALSLARFMGVKSIYFQGNIHFDPTMIALSVLLSVVVCTLASWLFFRVLSIFPSMDIIRTLVSVVGVLGITAVYYVRLIGVVFHYHPAVTLPNNAVPYTRVVVIVLTCAVVFSFVALSYVLSDLRSWLQKTSTQLHHADRALVALINQQKGSSRVPQQNTNNNNHHHQNKIAKIQEMQNKMKYLQLPLEVVNYSRQFLQPVDTAASRRRIQQQQRQNGSSGSSGTNSHPNSPFRPLPVFALAPPIYYDIENTVEADRSTDSPDYDVPIYPAFTPYKPIPTHILSPTSTSANTTSVNTGCVSNTAAPTPSVLLPDAAGQSAWAAGGARCSPYSSAKVVPINTQPSTTAVTATTTAIERVEEM